MAQTKSQNQTKKEVVFQKIRVRGDYVEYKAFVGDYVVRGLTSTKEAAMEVLERMARADLDLIDKLKALVAKVTDNVMSAIELGTDVSVSIGTTFYLGEYMLVAVKLQRITHQAVGEIWWGKIVAMFKGCDGYKSPSKHVVTRYVEFDKIKRDKLYKYIYEVVRTAFNAHYLAQESR